MRASTVLQKCLIGSLSEMHAARARTLLSAVEALVAGRRLTLMDLARSWPGALRVRAPLKAADRLLSNPHLHAERMTLYSEMAQWLCRSPQPVIVVDWSDATRDRRWQLLRAAVPVGGRTLPLLDLVVPLQQLAAPKVERAFLATLQSLLPPGARPVIVTDAGFRAPWFRAVKALGWLWVGRLRNRTQIKPVEVPDAPDQWVPCKALYPLALQKPRDFGAMHMVASNPWPCRLVAYRKLAKGRKHRRLDGAPAEGNQSRKNAQREREPWLIVASPELDATPRQLVNLYGRRMQIELSFRDLKSHHYGQGFEDTQTRKAQRLQTLLLIHALANFAAWLVGSACEQAGIGSWLTPYRSQRRLYAVVRLGREAMVRQWPVGTTHQILETLRKPTAQLLQQMTMAS